jgi:branched-chain amino acid transport system substrate-binding protein
MLEALVDSRSFVLAAATDRDSHEALAQLQRALNAARRTPAMLVEFDPRESDLRPLAARLAEPGPDGVVVLAPAPAAARLIGALREGGFDGILVAGAAAASSAFGRAAGSSAEGVRVPLLWEPSDAWDGFARAFEARWGERPDHLAAQSFDAARLVVAALREAGPNRARVRDAVRAASPWQGAAGVIRWDALGRNERSVPGLAVWRAGQLAPVSNASAGG